MTLLLKPPQPPYPYSRTQYKHWQSSSALLVFRSKIRFDWRYVAQRITCCRSLAFVEQFGNLTKSCFAFSVKTVLLRPDYEAVSNRPTVLSESSNFLHNLTVCLLMEGNHTVYIYFQKSLKKDWNGLPVQMESTLLSKWNMSVLLEDVAFLLNRGQKQNQNGEERRETEKRESLRIVVAVLSKHISSLLLDHKSTGLGVALSRQPATGWTLFPCYCIWAGECEMSQ